MKIFAIGDLHLPGLTQHKTMDMFGPAWVNHFQKIQDDWQQRVTQNDIVLIPGDISWAMHLEEAVEDLNAIGRLNGQKVLLKGNHDFWWSSLVRLRQVLHPSISLLQNNVVEFDYVSICGTRGWLMPCKNATLSELDTKIYLREVNRLKLSLAQLKASSKVKIGMMHYPPLLDYEKPTAFSTLFSEYGISQVVYGHLHGESIKTAFNGEFEQVHYHLTSADALDFKLKEIIY